MAHGPSTSEAVHRIQGIANDARIAAMTAEERRLRLERARDVAEDMHVLKADESTIAAFVNTVLGEIGEVGK